MTGPRRRCTVVLAMLVVLLIASCGCTGLDYVPDRDIVVLGLTPAGALAWTTVIDEGFDDMASDLAALPDGGCVIACEIADARARPGRPVVIRLAPDGAVAWRRFVTDGPGVARAVVPAADGGVAVLTGDGTVVRFDADGRESGAGRQGSRRRAPSSRPPTAALSRAEGSCTRSP